MRISDDLLKSVCFLCVKGDFREGEQHYTYKGTAFFVGAPPDVQKTHSECYLVTAKHCVDMAEQDGGLVARVNPREGVDHNGVFQLDKQDKWIYPEDPASDVALLPWYPSQEQFDFLPIPHTMFVTWDDIEKYDIGRGDDIVVTGLFTERVGAVRNNPIVRKGIIAAMPDEPMVDKVTGLNYNAYLVEMRSIGGLSGSPVFVVLDPWRGKTLTKRVQYSLLGLVRGHWQHQNTDPLIDLPTDKLEQVNMGIGIVTPVQDLWNVISQIRNL